MLLFLIIMLLLIAYPVISLIRLLLLPFERPLARLRYRIFSADHPLFEIFIVILELIRHLLIGGGVILLAMATWNFFYERRMLRGEGAAAQQCAARIPPAVRENDTYTCTCTYTHA